MNSLNRDIVEGEKVVVSKKYAGDRSAKERIFICESGFGMMRGTMGGAIFGKWQNGEKDRIEGYMIAVRETKQLARAT